MKQIKPYNQVKIGDMAMESPDAGNNWDHELGEIVWKGTLKELKNSKRSTLSNLNNISVVYVKNKYMQFIGYKSF